VTLTPSEIKSQQIKVAIPDSLLDQEAQLPIYVMTSTGLSNVVILRVTPAESPYIFSLSPNTLQAGTSGARVAVIGANFKENSDVKLNGTAVNTKFVGAARVSFKLSKDQLANPATYTVTVTNPDGSTSNSVTLTVTGASTVSTLAGKSLDGFIDGSADVAKFRYPSRAAVGPDGMLYVTDQANHAVRRVDPSTGFVETLAGDGKPGYVDSGDSSAEGFTAPRFNNPLGVAVGADGAVYVADYGNNVVRRIRANGGGFVVDTVAGANERIDDRDTRDATNSTRRGLQGYFDGAGSAARFRGVDGMSMGADGTLYLADAQNFDIRAINTTNGSFTVSTIAGLGIGGFADGDVETARFTLPVDVAITPDQSALIVADLNNRRVRRIELGTGAVTTLAGNGSPGSVAGSALVATFTNPIGVTIAPDGTVFVADHGSNTIRAVTEDGTTSTLAGGSSKTRFRDGIGPEARFKDPRGIVYVPSTGELIVVDQAHSRLRRIEP